MFYAGIDIAKYKYEATVIGNAGKALWDSIPFANSKKGYEKLLSLFHRLGVVQEDVLVGMEATGYYWLAVYSYLVELGYKVKVINPIQSNAFQKMYIRQTKNDSKDSFIIAQIMRFGRFSVTTLSEENIVALQQLSRYRLPLVDTCGDCKRRTIALLDQVFPEYAAMFSDTFGVGFAKDAFTFQIRQLIEPVLLFQNNQVITTIPGIGDTLGSIILSEIGDTHRFDAPGKLVAFAGLDVKVTHSVEFTGTCLKISKWGLPYLRCSIWPAASRAAFCDSIFSEYCQGLRARRKQHLTAVGAVARKLCKIIFVIFRDNRLCKSSPPNFFRRFSSQSTI